MERIEHGRDQGERIAEPQREREVVPQREEPHANDGQRRGQDVHAARAPAGDGPVHERHHHAVRGGEKRVSSRGGVCEADVLHHEGRAGEKPEHRAAAQVARVQVGTHGLPKDRSHDEGGEEETDEHEPARRHHVKRALDHDERPAPDGGRACQGELPSSDGYVLLANHARNYTAARLCGKR